MVICSLGFDLIDLAHFEIHYGEDDPELLLRCFTAQEIAAAGDGVDRVARLAARYAVKEATFKAFGGAANISHLDIQTVSGKDGAPQIRLSGAAEDAASAHGITSFIVSISHSAASAGAVVIGLAGPR